MSLSPEDPADDTLPTIAKADETPQMIAGKYQVLSKLGQGGMGTVYKVRQILLDQELALKLLDERRVSDGIQMRRFQQEARAASALNHPGLIKVYDMGVLENGQPYQAMELINGCDLAEFVKRKGPLELKTVRQIFLHLCAALSAAHQKGIVHRDIKPSNIMIDESIPLSTAGSIKIVDFGIAKNLQQTDSQALTNTGDIFGSPYYMSPEQCAGGQIDQRSDIYSLGCVLYEVLTGAPPFMGKTALQTMRMHESGKLLPLAEASMGKEFAPELERLVAKMLAKAPDDRYQTIDEVELELGRDSKLSRTKARTEPSSSKSKATRMLPTFAILSLCALIAFQQLSMRSKQSNGASNDRKINATKSDKAATPGQTPPEATEMQQDLDKGKPVHAPNMVSSGATTQSQERIKSKLAFNNGVRMKKFDFPSGYTIGAVSDSLEGEHINQNPLEKNAIGSLFMPDKPLTFVINFDQLANSYPDDYKRIDPSEFEGLEIRGSMVNGLTENESPEQQEKYVLAVLKHVASWKNLHSIALQRIPLGDAEFKALNHISQLENLAIKTPSHGYGAVKDYDFFHNLRRFWLMHVVLEPYTANLRGSSRLEKFVITGCDVSDQSIRNLKDCKNLVEFRFLQPEISDQQTKELAKLRQLQILDVSKTELSLQNIFYLIKNLKLRELIVSMQNLNRTHGMFSYGTRITGG